MAKPKVHEQQATAQEQQLFDIAMQKHGNYQNQGVPLQNDYLQNINDELSPNGSVRVNDGAAIAANNQRYKPMLSATPNPNQGNGYQPYLSNKIMTDSAASTGAKFNQQSDYLQSLSEASQMGRDLQQPLLQSMGSLTGQSAQQAQNDSRIASGQEIDKAQGLSMLGGMGMQYGMRNAQALNPNGSFIPGAMDRHVKSSYLNFF